MTDEQFATAVDAEMWAALAWAADRLTDAQFTKAARKYPDTPPTYQPTRTKRLLTERDGIA